MRVRFDLIKAERFCRTLRVNHWERRTAAKPDTLRPIVVSSSTVRACMLGLGLRDDNGRAKSANQGERARPGAYHGQHAEFANQDRLVTHDFETPYEAGAKDVAHKGRHPSQSYTRRRDTSEDPLALVGAQARKESIPFHDGRKRRTAASSDSSVGKAAGESPKRICANRMVSGLPL